VSQLVTLPGDSLCSLELLLSSLSADPPDPRARTLRRTNPRFVRTVAPHDVALRCIRAVGFADDGEFRFVLEPSTAADGRAAAALAHVREAIAAASEPSGSGAAGGPGETRGGEQSGASVGGHATGQGGCSGGRTSAPADGTDHRLPARPTVAAPAYDCPDPAGGFKRP
jgi:hypothetical protein